MPLAAEYPVATVCALWGLARSTYYYQAQPAADATLRERLAALAAGWPTYGSRRLTAHLRREGWTIKRKHVLRLMHELGLVAGPARKRLCMTNSTHSLGRYPNRVQQLVVARPDQVWVCDLTYIKVRQGFVYLAVLMDVYTRSIRGWHLGRQLDGSVTLTALERALRQGRPAIHHSDQGVQYAAHAYAARLQAVGAQISMASIGEPTENGYAERLMRTIKEEEVDLSEYIDYQDAYRQIGRFLDEVYQHKRIHSALGYLTPAEFEQQWRTAQQPQPTGLP